MLAALAVACSTPAPDDQIRPLRSAQTRAQGGDDDDDDDDDGDAAETTPTKTTPSKVPTSTDATPSVPDATSIDDDPPVDDDPPIDDGDGPLDTPDLVDKGCCVSGRFIFCRAVPGATCSQVVVSEESCVNAPENDSQCL